MPGNSTPTLLRDMVQDALDRGQTYRQLAERAIDPETKQTASFSMLNDIARGNVKRAPSIAHLRAIAAALGKPLEAVRQAAINEYLPTEAEGAQAPADPESAAEHALLEQARQAEQLAQELRRLAAGTPGPGESATERESA